MTSAPPANSTLTTPATSKPPKYPRHSFLLILRWVLLLCWTFIVGVLYGGISTLIGVAENSPDQLRDPATWLGAFLLPKWLLADGAPLALRIAVPVGILVVLLGCIWATRDLIQQARHEGRSVITEIVDELLPGRIEAPPAPRIAEPDKLPLPATFVGREKEITQLEKDLRDGKNAGLFAVRGTGGVGKTALAALIVARLSNDPTFPGRAVWVSCEGRTGDEGLALVWADVARQLGAQDIATEPDPDARRAKLAAELAQRERTLIALDNVEKGLDGDALLDTLSRPGHTAVLITSRQQVAPHRLTSLELEPLEQQDATTLFRDRLRQADSSRPTPDDEAALPELLALLGGLPLSVEMTATYAGRQRLPLSEIIREVREDGLNAEALSFDPKRAPRTRFERSWRALTSSQQQTFAGLSVLAGASFPREAALSVAEAAGGKATGDLGTLVDYSLVEALPGGQRLRLHPQLREYAAEQLAALPGEAQDKLGDAALAWWIAYAQAHPGYEGMDALEAEAEGLMGALQWAHDHQRFNQLLALAHSLSTPWDTRGRREQTRQMIEWAIAAAAASGAGDEQLWTLYHQAVLLGRTGQVEASREAYAQVLRLAQEQQNKRYEQLARHGLAVRDTLTGRIAEARVGYEEALRLAKELSDVGAIQTETHSLAVLDAQTGQIAEARAGYEEALRLAKELGDLSAMRAETHGLAALDDDEGNHQDARDGYLRALELARQLGDPSAEANELRNLAGAVGDLGETDQARKYLQESLALSQRINDPQQTGWNYNFLGRLDEQEGRTDDAIADRRAALHYLEPIQSPDAEEARKALRRLGATP